MLLGYAFCKTQTHEINAFQWTFTPWLKQERHQQVFNLKRKKDVEAGCAMINLPVWVSTDSFSFLVTQAMGKLVESRASFFGSLQNHSALQIEGNPHRSPFHPKPYAHLPFASLLRTAAIRRLSFHLSKGWLSGGSSFVNSGSKVSQHLPRFFSTFLVVLPHSQHIYSLCIWEVSLLMMGNCKGYKKTRSVGCWKDSRMPRWLVSSFP